ncbi:hypothetical protein [Imhoffiella purpurea]|nr:hypothetical protein [Imhoffiella purpurea]
MRGFLCLIFLLPALNGCGALQAAGDGARAVSAGSVQGPPEPDWRRSLGGVSVGRPGPGRSSAVDDVPESQVYSSEPVELRRELARVCARTGALDERNFLRSLVADLYFSGVDPAEATEALLLGRCGDSSDILEEMAAQGGEPYRDVIAQRAISVMGPSDRRRVERAVAAGVARQTDLAEAERGLDGDRLPAYGMLYFPSTGEGRRLDASMALNRLFDEAVPGYGIYTFVLVGRGYTGLSGVDADRYRELFRLIETYVATTPEELGSPSAEAHVFLVPVDPRGDGRSLADLVSGELSDLMRSRLRQELRRDGQGALASRLATGRGPFLVATLEPALLPSSPRSPRLVADLSEIGPEYLYGVVDAYDRPIPLDLSGDARSLALIRERLLRIPIKPKTQGGGISNPGAAWILMLGHFAGDIQPLLWSRRLARVILQSIEQRNV